MRFVNLFAFVAGSYYTLRGEISLGDFVGFILLSNIFIQPIQRLSAMLELYPKGISGFNRLQNTLLLEPTIEDSPDAIEAPEFAGYIEYKDVSFGYDEGKEVLSGIKDSN